MTTPVVFDCIILGHIYKALTFAILPFTLMFMDKSIRYNDMKYAIVAAILVAIAYLDVGSIIFIWLAMFLFLLVNFVIRRINISTSFKVTIIIALVSLLLHSYWIFPIIYSIVEGIPLSSSVLTEPSLQRIMEINCRLTPFNVVRMWGGLFNYQFETSFNKNIEIVTIMPAILASVPLLVLRQKFRKNDKYVVFILFSAVLMLIPMAISLNRSILALNSILYTQREINRYLIYEALSYSLSISMLFQIIEKKFKKPRRYFVTGILIGIIVMNAHPWFLGEITTHNKNFFDARLSTFEPPDEYDLVENLIMNINKDVKVLWLPTGSYLLYVKYDKNYDEPFKNMADIWSSTSLKAGGFAYVDGFAQLILDTLLNPSVNKTIIERILGLCSIESIILRKQMVCWNVDGDLLFEVLVRKEFNDTFIYNGHYITIIKIPYENFLPHIYSSVSPVLISGSLKSVLLYLASDCYAKTNVFLFNETFKEGLFSAKSMNFTAIFNENPRTITVPAESESEKPFNFSQLAENSIEARYYFGWKSVVRTDGKESESSLSFSSPKECPYVFPPFSLGCWNALNSTLVFIKTGSQPMVIKEVLEDGNLIKDIYGIWWETEWMGMMTSPIKFPVVIPAHQRAIIQIGHIIKGNITVALMNLTCSRELATHKLQLMPTITFKRVNPTKYVVSVENASTPFLLVFSESYDPQWKVYVEDRREKFDEIIAEYSDLNVKEAKHDWFKLTLQDVAYLLKRPAIDEIRHFKVNGYANAWYIDPKEIDADGDGRFTITIYYLPQSWFYVGLIISSLTLITCISCLLYWRIRRGLK